MYRSMKDQRKRVSWRKYELFNWRHSYVSYYKSTFPKIEYNFSNEKINEIDMIPNDEPPLPAKDFTISYWENGYESKEIMEMKAIC